MIPHLNDDLTSTAVALQLSEKNFPRLKEVNANKKTEKDNYQLTLYRFLKLCDPNLYQNLSSFNSSGLLDKKVLLKKAKEWVKVQSAWNSLFVDLKNLNEKETAYKKALEWFCEPKFNLNGEQTSIQLSNNADEAVETVKDAARKFLKARDGLRDTPEGRDVRAKLNPFEEALYKHLNESQKAATDQKVEALVQQMMEEMTEAKYSDYVCEQAGNFAKKWLKKQSKAAKQSEETLA